METLNVRDDLQALSPEELRKVYLDNCNKDAVMCLNLTGEINIGMVIRTASLFSMGKVIIVGKRKYDKRTTVGMHNYIPLEIVKATSGVHNDSFCVSEIVDLIENYKKNYNIVFVEHGGILLKDIHKVLDDKIDKPTMFIMGSENNGIPEEILNIKDTCRVSITQKGIGRSFNVATAFSMVVYEFYR